MTRLPSAKSPNGGRRWRRELRVPVAGEVSTGVSTGVETAGVPVNADQMGEVPHVPSSRSPETGDLAHPKEGAGAVKMYGKSLFALWGKLRKGPLNRRNRSRLYSIGTPLTPRKTTVFSIR